MSFHPRARSRCRPAGLGPCSQMPALAGACQISGAGAQACFGAVSFIHRFGASLNRHVHVHWCVIDGVFEAAQDAGVVRRSVRFRAAAERTPEAVATITEQVCVRGGNGSPAAA
jgi:hypothetical protein